MRKVFYSVLAALALFFSLPGTSQDYRISHFGLTEGISHQYVYTVSQDNHGYIWIGTGQGLCRFNGIAFDTDILQDSLGTEVAQSSIRDSRGVLWFGYQNGDIAKYDGTSFSTIKPGVEISSAVTGFATLEDGNLIVSTQNNGLFSMNAQTGAANPVSGIDKGLFTALSVKGKILLLGSMEGLTIYSIDGTGNNAEVLMKISEFDFIKIQDIQPSYAENIFWIATEEDGVFRLTLQGGTYDLTKIATESRLASAKVQSVLEDSDKHLWVSTLLGGLYRLSLPDKNGNFASATLYNKQNGLSEDAVKKVFEDIEGNIWIATYGGGLNLFTGQAFSFLQQDVNGLDNDIQSVVITDEDIMYLGGPGGLFRGKKGADRSATRIAGVPADRIMVLHTEGNKLYIGTEKNGLFLLDIRSGAVRKIAYEAGSLGSQVSAIATSDQYVYLGTRDGIYKFSKDLREAVHFTTTSGLPHNSIEQIYFDSKGRLLIATRANGIFQLTEDDSIKNLFPAGNTEIEFKSVIEDDQGGIWAATYGDGIVYFKDDSVYQFTVSSGLKSNYCYSLAKGPDQSIWIGHRLGLSRIKTSTMKISVFDKNMDITGDCNPNASFVDKTGVLYFGTTEGLVTYDPSLENEKKQPPFTNIVSLLISDKPYDFGKEIVLPYRPYKLRIDFIGLNYSDPQSVRYQYKLEGNDLEWSDVTSQTYVTYPRIEDGEYIFYLRSFNNEGLSQETPVTVKIRIKPPFWKTWWFMALSLLTLVSAVYLIIKIRERKQKQLQEYLERELTLRTKEVVEQKEVIEIKNRDITDSINYAKRIQTSMLPPIRRLQQHFSGCFVFYSPRDIVSGDFYWFDQVNNNKFTIVCADSTGHGVPGAFMSMIGSTLIKDICTREAGNSPSQVLQVLDNELRNTLNQNLEDGTKPGDGMDIIVCEIDLKTHYVRYASAMRPMIIYRNGEEYFVKGSRNSVGGHYDREDNLFEDEGLQLSKGDIIYMFSDGYSDQFGGPMGKKFKMVRLKNLLQDIHQKPMEEQYTHVKNTFNLWKENYDQVDDVLFMGIKI
ncbi:MAG: SpoIIE family protein phosphatase [Bacteroidales bacterium]|nr:SpoIIE family protein phosphatase [Bacteroidales bacterium]